jgi:hypothetical protein
MENQVPAQKALTEDEIAYEYFRIRKERREMEERLILLKQEEKLLL